MRADNRCPGRYPCEPMPNLRASLPRFRKRFLLLHLLACLALALLLLLQIRPVMLPDLQLAAGEKLDCVSYSPFRRPGQTPLDPAVYIPRQQIEADLASLVPLTRCVRIYAVNQGLEQVPDVARALGLKVLLGAWVGYQPESNRQELETAIDLANRYPDVVRGLIVGNEVMLRREQSEAALKALLDEARRRVQVPVSYADVWEFWLRHPGLAKSVDFITLHILPYWEDEPVAVEQAIPHVAAIHDRIREHFGKPVLIGETGWPSRGRQRNAARPGRVAQARYIRSFVHEAHVRGWNYNLIEAIDQPWKRRLEGTVGGYWGILDVDLQAKFPFQGAVSERQSLQAPLFSSLCGLLGGLGLACLGGRKRPVSRPAAAIAGAWLGGMLFMAWEHGRVAYRDAWEWGVSGGVVWLGMIWVLGYMLPGSCGRSRISVRQTGSWRSKGLRGVRLGLLFAAATVAILLFADPRYRDFPFALYLLPLPTLLAIARFQVEDGLEEGVLAAVLVACGLARWLLEPGNPEAQGWAALCLLLGMPVLANISRESRAAGAERSKQ